MPQNEGIRAWHLHDAAAPGEDGELSRLGAEFQQEHHRHTELVEKQQRSVGNQSPADQQEVQSLMRRKQKLAEAIAGLSATTLVGLRVKAAVLMAYSQYDIHGKLHWTDHDELLGWSIAQDLLGDSVTLPSGIRSGGAPRS
jgi:hypothetical protein